MGERLGNVLYWAASLLAIVFLVAAAAHLLAAAGLLAEPEQSGHWLSVARLAFFAGAAWLVGRGLLYLFAER